MLLHKSSFETGFLVGEKFIKRVVKRCDPITGAFDYAEYLRDLDVALSPPDHQPKLTSAEQTAVYLMWRLSLVVKKHSPLWDWIVFERTWPDTVNIGKSTDRYLLRTEADIRKGALNTAIRRSLSYLSTIISRPLTNTKFLTLKNTKDDRISLGVSLRPKEISDFRVIGKTHVEQAFSIMARILASIEDQDAVKHLLNKRAITASPEIIENIFQAALSNDNLEEADHHLKILCETDPYNPLCKRLGEEIERHKKIVALADSKGKSFEDVLQLSGIEFEELVIKSFKDAGYKARSTPRSGDYGADAIIDTEAGTRIVVQCKRYKAKLNLRAVQEVTSAMSHYSADFGIVITTNGFLKSAVELSKSADVELWGQEQLLDFLAGDFRFSCISEL